ncbi:transporter substrate-binding domain-containing protein [Mycolicibacterium austroafricanum]|uniref:non-specific serine/threonine protein kinase n=1 Tax=Mycolicibacterium austroafricanum TaxID=39687 RepID=A0ABT8HI17_MYCAO|nr:bifunctional serine/threonine-protein kinase/transporter substrate-binding domain-containing protein [Mycolicibacterium austroafricanum]MDN4520410.1 bifunctional serine/threonine-protein kinase/transporter substrate-binding domain-containing protein [Mycolicibacterium austroafricanum]PQP38764.1 protein kinase [Mycolicibacterium austroafricanum]QRZ07711.1 transporter substrate-binding domain-containing protein [Mycolicibacterium austroafricanum]QZT69374.1 transporter substrate-binding domain-
MNATPFGHYRLQKLIGRGGMGEVYQAYDTKTDRVVALKVLPHSMAQDETFQARFRRESQAAAGINDPHVVPIHGYGEIDGRLYLDMRLIEGRNLGTMLQETEKPLGAAFAVTVVEQVANGLDAAHKLDLIHRDIKPSNILITGRDFVYLIDFGLARTAGEKGLTTAGSTLGTLAYMAPERFEGGEVDARSDIYALTCVLYECLTGSRPYPADSLEQQIAGHMVSEIPRPSDTDPRLAAFDEVIAKGMAKKPDKRYQSAGELAQAAKRALNAPVRRPGRTSRHAAARPDRKKPHKGLLAAGAAVLVAALVGIGLWVWAPWRHDAGAPLPDGAVEAIAATVPADIRGAGRLVIGVNVPYAPMEFKNADGQLVGFDVELMDAVTRVLGLVPDYRNTTFDAILPSVVDGTFDVGMSSVTDTREREELVDFVTYLEAGTQWARRPGTALGPAAACGLKVGVAEATLQATEELPAKSDQCTAAGMEPIEMVVFKNQDEVTTALIKGEVDAMSADSPVTGFAIKLSRGELVPAGDVFDSAPYGWPVAKGSGLTESLRLALEHLIESGDYRAIATMWGVERGMIDEPAVNGATR